MGVVRSEETVTLPSAQPLASAAVKSFIFTRGASGRCIAANS
jgi:hypothetical protein